MKRSARPLMTSHVAASPPVAARLHARIATLLRDVAFLRSLPPDTYVSFTPSANARHLTAVIDGESASCPPLTRAAFLLRTEVRGEGLSLDECCLVGCPHAHSQEDGSSFVERLLRAGDAHKISAVNRKLNVAVLPEFHPGVGNVLTALDDATEKPVRVVTDSFTAAYLTDPTFFDGVKRALVQEHHQRVPWLAHLKFPGLEADRVSVAKTGDKVSLANGQRQLAMWVAPAPTASASSRRPSHFHYAPMTVFDKATRTLIVGGELGGWRFPWAHGLHRALPKGAVLPKPHWMHRASVCDRGHPSPLLSFWRPEQDIQQSLDAIRHFTFAQRIVSLSYAELGSDREDVIAELEKSTAALVDLRKRLSGKVFRMKREDPTVHLRMASTFEMLCKALLHKVEEEMFSMKRPTEADASPPSGGATEHPGGADDRALCIEGLETYALDNACRSLCCTAIDLAPTEGAALVASSNEPTTTSARLKDSADASSPVSLPTPDSIAILEKVLAKRGFESLTPTLRAEQIDADVFLAMSLEEITRTFKLTFGLTKKLQGLQEELKGRLSTGI